MRPHPYKTVLALFVALFLLLMITYPAAIYRGAAKGIAVWWGIVFPALLPFFIVTELFLALGVVHFLGALLEPLTQKVFRLLGAVAFAITVGFTSGYPMGAAVAARLKSEGLLSPADAARLAAFANNASPLFILVAVAVSMYHNPQLGPFLAGIHYASNILTGLTLGLFARAPASRPIAAWQRAVEALAATQRSDLRNIGQLASDAVRHAINNLFTIAGFICIFAVILQLFGEVSLLQALMQVWGSLLQKIGVPEELWPVVGAGFFEITLGTKTAAATAPLSQKLLVTEAILSWGGLSVVGQALSFLAAAKVPGGFFIIGRFLQALYACALTRALFPLFAPRLTQATAALVLPAAPSFTATLAGATTLCLAANLALGVLALAAGLCRCRRCR